MNVKKSLQNTENSNQKKRNKIVIFTNTVNFDVSSLRFVFCFTNGMLCVDGNVLSAVLAVRMEEEI